MESSQVATFGGGCFWCIEAIIQRLKGVERVVSGYTGGHVKGRPTYREVCSGRTGHAEVVRVTFDPEVICYYDLLLIFLTCHDPTQFKKQEVDLGSQYRSVIYYHSGEQLEIAKKVINDLSMEYTNTIVTEISEAGIFYEAEDYHQNYYNNNSQDGYCVAIIDPKILKLREKYAQVYRVGEVDTKKI